jgi:hypothetical protein
LQQGNLGGIPQHDGPGDAGVAEDDEGDRELSEDLNADDDEEEEVDNLLIGGNAVLTR